MLRKSLAGVLSAVLLNSTAAYAASDFSEPVTKDFWEDNITWNGGLGNAYDFRWYVIGYKGKIAVCGVGHFNDPVTRMQSKELMRRAEVLIDGKRVLTDITFFATVKKGADLSKATANCRETGAAEPDRKYNIGLKMGGSARF